MTPVNMMIKNRKNIIYNGAVCGLYAGIIYGLVEFAFSYLLPYFLKGGWACCTLHWGYMALLFLIYGLAGTTIGILLGFLFYFVADKYQKLELNKDVSFLQPFMTISIILLFLSNMTYRLVDGATAIIALLLSALLVVILSAVVIRKDRYEVLKYFNNPALVLPVLLGIPWFISYQLPDYTRTIKAIITFTAYIAASAIIYFALKQTVNNAKQNVKWKLVFAGVVVFVTIGLNIYLNKYFLKHAVLELPEKTSTTEKKRPDIILIVMDTVRADHLSVYGYERETTPFLNKFVENATLFKKSKSSGAMTLTTHASMFTGMYARSHGAHVTSDEPGGKPLAGKFNTMAEILAEDGYNTAGVVSNHGYLSSEFNMDQGFRYYDIRCPMMPVGETNKIFFRESIRDALKIFIPRISWEKINRSAETINQVAYNLLGQLKNDDNPFFLFINYMDAHEPYIPPAPFDTLFEGKMKNFSTSKFAALKSQVMSLVRNMTEKEKRHLLSQYDGGIAYIDSRLEKLIGRLKGDGLYENSLIIITSDHGEAFGEKNMVTHGLAVYEDVTSVPLIIKYPNQNRGRIVDEIVSSVDYLPTVLDIIGKEVPEYIQGTSLLKIGNGIKRNVISESYTMGYWKFLHPRFDRIQRALYSWPYKFISSTDGELEFYDLSKDPDEENNLYDGDSAVAKQMSSKLTQWLDTVALEKSEPASLDRETIENLKALGYIQ